MNGKKPLPLFHLGQLLFMLGLCFRLFPYPSNSVNHIIAALFFDPVSGQPVGCYAPAVRLGVRSNDFGFNDTTGSNESFGQIFRNLSIGVLVKHLELALRLIANHSTDNVELWWVECTDSSHLIFLSVLILSDCFCR